MPLYRVNDRIILFMHIPKTGGTSVDRWLSEQGPAMMSRADPPDWLPCPPQHLHARALARLVPPDMPDFSFAVVRHPEDRLISEFFYRHHARTRRIWPLLRRRRFANLDQDRLSRYFAVWFRHVLARYRRDPFACSNHLRPQCAFTDWPGLKVYRLEDGLMPVFADLARATGIAAPELPPRENASGRRSFAIDPATRALIRDVYAADFAAFYPGEPLGLDATSTESDEV